MEKARETSQLEVNINIDLIPPVSRPVVFLYPREVKVHHLECLIQGDNKPIILEFDENIANIEQISAVLYGDQKEYKRWDEKSAVMENDEIQLPLSQEETIAIDSDYVKLEIKLVSNGIIEFFEIIPIRIRKRKDETVFELGGGQS